MAITKVTNSLVAVNAIQGTLIADNAITSVHIAQNQVTAVQIPDGSITSTQIAANSIDTAELVTGSIDTIHIGNDQVTTAKIADLNVTTGKIANNAITSAKIPDGSITATQLDSSTAPTFGNITTTGSLRGPASFTIDPAAVGDNTGTVVIAGSLQVDGTTTTVNSTTLSVADKNIVVASGAADAAAANDAGLTVTGASATLLYKSSGDKWSFNKPLDITGDIDASGLLKVGVNDTEYANNYLRFKSAGAGYIDHNTVGQDINFRISNSSALDTTIMTLDAGVGSVGINQTSPSSTYKLDVGGAVRSIANAPSFNLVEQDSSNQHWQLGSYGGIFALRDVSDNRYPLQVSGTGNHVGIGTAPAAWDGSMTALQLDTGSIYVNSVGGTYIGANFYYDTTSNTNKYIESNYAAAALGLSTGRHEFYVAGSGTAGNDVSFTEAMRIHSDGKVGIGSDVVSGPVMGLHVGNGSGVLFGPSGSSGSTYISPDHENTINGNYGMDADNTDLWVNYRGYQNGTSRFRNFKVGQGKEDLIAVFEGSSGNVGIGIANGTSPTAKLHVGGTIKGTDLIAHDSDGLAFQTDEGTKRISILDSGNVVIGDNSLIGTKPTGSALNIFGDGVTLRLDGSGNATKSILFRGTSAGNPGEVYADGGLRLRTEDSGMPITFYTNSTGTNNERMRIDGTDGSVRFKVGAGDSGTNTTNTGSVTMSNTDLDADTQYTIRGGRYLTSNGTGWGSPDGRNPALVIHNDVSTVGDRSQPGIIMHNENNTTSAYGPFIGWGAKSPSGAYNTGYAWIMGRPTANGPDSNWRAGELEIYTQSSAYVADKPGIRITSDGLVQQPRLYDSNGFFWARSTSNPSGQSGTTGVVFTTRAQAGSGNFSTSTGRYTTPVDGVYHFSTNVRIDNASSASTYLRIAFYTGTSPSTNQTSYGQGHSIYGPGSYSTSYFSMQTSWSVYLSAGTQVGVAVNMDSGTYTIHSESQFSGHLVG